jgi:predicted lipid-binding transport protein (Tim44 family)
MLSLRFGTSMDQNTVGATSGARQRHTVLVIGTAIAATAFGLGAAALLMQGENGRAAFYGCLCLLSIVLGVRAWKDRQKAGKRGMPDHTG